MIELTWLRICLRDISPSWLKVLYLKEVDTMLALVCITRAENFRKKSLINYNIGCLKRALRALVQSPTTAENGH
jgi:hypothetical protein